MRWEIGRPFGPVRSAAIIGVGMISSMTLALGSVYAAGGLAAQAKGVDEQLRFEVASIVPHRDSGSTRVGFEDHPSIVRMENLSLRALIRIAYGVMDAQIVAPGWLAGTFFDVVAKPPAGYESRQLPILLRNLLADRFKLVVHREKKNVAGFALRVPAGGHRLIEAKGERTFLTGRPGLIAGNGRSIAEIVPVLAQMVGAPVSDQTGLPGRYDLKLEWTPELGAGNNVGSEPEVSIFTALREQLGLRLDRVMVAVDVVAVDAVARTPTEN